MATYFTESPINLLEPFISYIPNDIRNDVINIANDIQNEYNDMVYRSDSELKHIREKNNKHTLEIIGLKKDNVSLKHDITKLNKRIDVLIQENEILKQDTNNLKADKIMLFYRQIINEIYNIAIQKTMGWSSKKRRKEKINGLGDFQDYFEDNEWEKYSIELNINLNNMGVTDDLQYYINTIID